MASGAGCGEHCTSEREYVKGDYLEITMKYDAEGAREMFSEEKISEQLSREIASGQSAQEIADSIQKYLEKNGGMACKQY